MSQARNATSKQYARGPIPWPFAERHAGSAQFEWTERAGPFRRLTRDQIGKFDRLGYFVLEDALDPVMVDQILTEVDPCARAQTGFYGDKRLTFTCNRATRTPSLRRLCRMDLMADLCHDLIGANAHLYWDQAVYKEAESSSTFPWHQDSGYGYAHPPEYLTCWIALTDATLDNGCIVVFPGVHQHGIFEHRLTKVGMTCARDPYHTQVDLEGAVPLPVSAGSIVVLSSLTPHATGPNRTLSLRKAFVLQFAPHGTRATQESGTQRGPAERLSILENGVIVRD